MSAGGYPAVHEMILACVDGSTGGYAAMAEAAELAKRFSSRIIVLSVEEGLPRYAGTIGEVDEFKREKDEFFAEVDRQAAQIAGEHGAKVERFEIRIGHAADVIVHFVDEIHADLVVMGYKGHSRIARFVIGTTAQKVNAYSKASVLIVKPTQETEHLWQDGPSPRSPSA